MKKYLYILTLTAISITAYGQEEKTMRNFDPTFVHTVFFWLNNPDNESDRTKFETSLKKFLDSSLYAHTKFIGKPPAATRDVVDGSFTYSLVLSFESAEAQKKYQEEKAHLLFIKESADLWNKVIVYDSMGIEQ